MFIVCGVVYIVMTLILSIAFHNKFNELITMVLSIGIVPVVLIGVCFSEIHLRSIFDNDGNRK